MVVSECIMERKSLPSMGFALRYVCGAYISEHRFGSGALLLLLSDMFLKPIQMAITSLAIPNQIKDFVLERDTTVPCTPHLLPLVLAGMGESTVRSRSTTSSLVSALSP